MRLNDPRGYSTHMKETIRAFGELGHDVFTVLGNGNFHTTKTVRKNNQVTNRIRKRIPGHIYEKFRIIYDLLHDIRFFFRVKRVVQKFKPDFIYDRYLLYRHIGIFVSKIYQIPIILEYNSPITERNVHYSHHQRRIGRMIEKKSLSAGDAIIVVSNFLKEYLVKIGIDPKKITIIPNGVNDNLFQPNIRGDRVKEKYNIKNKRVIGFVGAFCRWHGTDALLGAASEIIKKIDNVHFLMVGEGPMLSSSKEFVKRNGMSECITFTGDVPYEYVPEYIAAMDIVTMPSSNIYGSPIKIFEYMAMQKPIIAPNVGPVQEIIHDGYNGILIKPGNKDAIYNKIMYLLKNRNLAEKISENARIHVLERHTWKKNVEKIIQISSCIKM